MTASAADLMQGLTDRRFPCPHCTLPMVGARIGICGDHPHGVIGVACPSCDLAYEVRDV